MDDMVELFAELRRGYGMGSLATSCAHFRPICKHQVRIDANLSTLVVTVCVGKVWRRLAPSTEY
jgi:hypothetical protein